MQANGTTRVPPQAPDAETSVLGAILRDNAAMDRVMDPEDMKTWYRQQPWPKTGRHGIGSESECAGP